MLQIQKKPNMKQQIREQMNRYPVFSCNQMSYIDESDLFKDEQIHSKTKKTFHQNFHTKKKNQTIISIYDRIANNNESDPLYPKRPKTKINTYSTVTSARQSKQKIQRQKQKNNTLTKFVGEFASSISHEGSQVGDFNRIQKISLLRRIIDHYNIKSVEKKYYSNLIRTFGLKIESFNSAEIAVKKDLHPRINPTTKLSDQPSQSQQLQPQTPNLPRKFKQSTSFTISKDQFPSSELQTHHNNRIRTIKSKCQSRQLLRRSIQISNKMIQRPLKMHTSCNTIQNKLNKYRDFLFVLNVSNHMYRDLDVEEYKGIFKYYVGKGNNGNLVKSLMRKRFWFQETSNIQQANFIWTQLKIEQVFERQPSSQKSQYLQQKLIIEISVSNYTEQSQTNNNNNNTNNTNNTNTNTNTNNTNNNTNKPSTSTSKYSSSKQLKQKQQEKFQLSNSYNNNNSNNNRVNFCNLKAKMKKLNSNNHNNGNNINNSNANNINNNVNNGKTTIKTQKNPKTQQPQHSNQPLLKICSEQICKNIQQMHSALNYKKNPTFHQKSKHHKNIIKDNIPIHQTLLHNHLPYNGLLGNKKAMFYNLREFCQLSRKQLANYVPVTFHIKNGFLDEEYKKLAEMYNQRKKGNLPNYWIIKPGEFSNRGQGISCTNKLEEIRKRIMKCKEGSNKNKMRSTVAACNGGKKIFGNKDNNKQINKNKSNKDATLIIQQYIHNPLLYNYRKFDIRAYMMLTIHNGKLKGYWYQQGYIRTSSFIWTLTEIQDNYIHLTNDAIQKNCEQYGQFQPGNKISYTELQRYLNTLPKNGRNLDFYNIIYPKMRTMATDLIKGTFLNLDPERKRDNFQIFGLDFMIDYQFRPWLIEVNTNPCLEISCSILERIIPYMVQNAFRIAVDPLFPPPSSISSISQQYKYSIPENALHYNKFQLIFDEDRDGPPITKLYENSTILQNLDDIEQDKQVFEGEGEIMDFGDI